MKSIVLAGGSGPWLDMGTHESLLEHRPIKTKQYPTKALRPVNSCLPKEKIKTVFGIPVRPWQESLESFMNGLAVHPISKKAGAANGERALKNTPTLSFPHRRESRKS